MPEHVAPNAKTLRGSRKGIDASELPVFEETRQGVSWTPEPVVATAFDPASLIAEEFRLLCAKVRTIADQRPFRCVGMVSGSQGEGKTTISLGLAAAMAREPDRRVLLIEADFRRSAVETYLGLTRAPGLAEWLSGWDETVNVRNLGEPGFFLLTAGAGATQPELFRSVRMIRLLEAARRCFDYVIVDCPPLIPVADSVLLQDLVDGFLLVVRARHCPRETIQRAISHLNPDRVQGVVLNDYHEVIPSYYTYAYRYYKHSPRG